MISAAHAAEQQWQTFPFPPNALQKPHKVHYINLEKTVRNFIAASEHVLIFPLSDANPNAIVLQAIQPDTEKTRFHPNCIASYLSILFHGEFTRH